MLQFRFKVPTLKYFYFMLLYTTQSPSTSQTTSLPAWTLTSLHSEQARSTQDDTSTAHHSVFTHLENSDTCINAKITTCYLMPTKPRSWLLILGVKLGMDTSSCFREGAGEQFYVPWNPHHREPVVVIIHLHPGRRKRRKVCTVWGNLNLK